MQSDHITTHTRSYIIHPTLISTVTPVVIQLVGLYFIVVGLNSRSRLIKEFLISPPRISNHAWPLRPINNIGFCL